MIRSSYGIIVGFCSFWGDLITGFHPGMHLSTATFLINNVHTLGPQPE